MEQQLLIFFLWLLAPYLRHEYNAIKRRHFTFYSIFTFPTILPQHSYKKALQLFTWLNVRYNILSFIESGSTARNASARISTARHFFQKCHLLDKKTSSAWQKKVCRTCSTCQFRAVDKKLHLLEFSSRWQNVCDSKNKIFNFFHIGKMKT